MTLNEWYRMNGLFRETELAYQIEAMSEALELDLAQKNEQVDGDCTIGDLEGNLSSIDWQRNKCFELDSLLLYRKITHDRS